MKKRFRIGYKHNKLLIIDEFTTEKSRRLRYKCLCDCGKEIELCYNSLIKKEDCGCISPNEKQKRLIDKIGYRKGKLVVLKKVGSNGESYIWLCQCDCGKTIEKTSAELLPNRIGSSSCGKCRRKTNKDYPSYEGYEEIPSYLIKSIKNGAKSRDLEYSITPLIMWNKFLQQKRRCALSGCFIEFGNRADKTTASLDRIDNTKGYITGNIQWTHKKINLLKNKYDEDFFINACEQIYLFNKEKTKKIERPDWIDYFFGIASVVSQRSVDAETKCGAILVNSERQVISTGYNSFPSGLPDDKFPNLRDEKYPFIVHAECNCIINAIPFTKKDKNCSMYVTMKPCLDCIKFIINSGIKNLFVIDREVSENTNKNSEISSIIIGNSNLNYCLVKPNLDFIKTASFLL